MTLKSDILGYPKTIDFEVIFDHLFEHPGRVLAHPHILNYHTGLLLALTTCSGNTPPKGCPK